MFVEFEVAVFVITQDGVSGAGKVDPDLMRPSGLDGHLQ